MSNFTFLDVSKFKVYALQAPGTSILALPLLLDATPVNPTPGSSNSRNVPMMELEIPKASAMELMQWNTEVYREGNDDGVSISGPSVDVVAEALLALLSASKSSNLFTSPPGVTVENFSLHAFTQRYQEIRM